jgi:uncharacterized protein (UPF0332 family)
MTFREFAEEYLRSGLLREQGSDLKAVQRLILRANKDLETAKANLEIDEGTAYSVAYMAMLRAGRAFMLLQGYRPALRNQHKTVVEFMAYFIGEQSRRLVSHFDRMRRKRNDFTYEADVTISLTEAQNALEDATEFVTLVKDMIKKENPQTGFDF